MSDRSDKSEASAAAETRCASNGRFSSPIVRLGRVAPIARPRDEIYPVCLDIPDCLFFAPDPEVHPEALNPRESPAHLLARRVVRAVRWQSLCENADMTRHIPHGVRGFSPAFARELQSPAPPPPRFGTHAKDRKEREIRIGRVRKIGAQRLKPFTNKAAMNRRISRPQHDGNLPAQFS